MIKSYVVDETCNDMRLDRWIRNKLGNIPQSLVEKSLRSGKIKVNKKKVKSSFKIKTGFEIQTFNINFKENILQKKIKYQPTDQVIKENENLIIDDNENFIVLNKKSGISVQGGTKSKKNLVDIFSKSEVFKNSKPYSVHRLDKDTSGVFIIAKNRETAQLLTSLFRLRKVHKTYLAICNGEIESDKGEWISDLIRYENGKKIIEKARTLYKVIDKNSLCSLVEMKPITGRKHQLRKQLYEIGNSIFGDTKYRNTEFAKGINKELMLHSYQIKFMINEKKYTYTALLPDYFKKLIKTKRLKFSN
ncbi:RluA family pseudouridine synthase [Candidatus Pelagibacter sp. HIMB1321]|uniref:RluA family pseudouridine synthase n=1 Tax=Candidatus Pelagibacter sp. HIMB1321 TaxID=1388755 RepID=UPI000A07F38C|nr:RNA pseudouridine synthase [Candidatus Pelagibacter sp. HIMB1321]SMF75994.1 ribosomal large subunit pseudouridine synthase C [Candidatus Pelagibacter sp. HIMB1321]